MASAVDSRLAYARLSAVATASRLPTANRGSNNSYTTSWDTTHFAIENVKAQAPQIRVVVLAERANDRLSQDAIGADGLIHWDLSGRVMMKALDIVLSGNRYVPVLGMGALPAPLKTPTYGLPRQLERKGPLQRLTPRERDVLNLLVKGHSNREIADRLSVKDITVSFHLKGLFRKLNAINRTQAATNALRLGWAA